MVTIILPNLNTPIAFLGLRIDSILGQEYEDWECIVIDGFSTNGSWEFILEKTLGNSKFSYFQKPAKGIYDSWNEGIKLAKGQFIYIATSDDLCDLLFLKEMVKALEDNPDCDLAHCCLNVIDVGGNPVKSQWRDWPKVQFYGDLIHQYHKRLAPYDAVVHFGWSTVYTSTVQLLIKKTLFSEIGYFNTHFCTTADYQWGLSASLKANLIHVPKYLASWRRHEAQASQENYLTSPAFYTDLITMAEELARDPKFREISRKLNLQELHFNYVFQGFNSCVKSKKIKYLAQYSLKMPYLTAKVVWYRLFKINYDTADFLKKNLTKRKLSDGFVLLK